MLRSFCFFLNNSNFEDCFINFKDIRNMWWICFLFCLALLSGIFFFFVQFCGFIDILGIVVNFSFFYIYDVFDIFNDDLSVVDQGVCGIDICFVYQYVDNFVFMFIFFNG